jgi:iron complex transport system substrate-binding protein
VAGFHPVLMGWENGAVKILSLLPSATEIVYALGLEDALEGVTHECDHPAGARTKPVVSTTSLPPLDDATPAEIDVLVSDSVARGEPLYRIDEDLVRDIRPDLILAQDLCRVCAVPSGQVADALQMLGSSAQVISLDPHGVDDVIGGIETVGRTTGVPERAAAVAGELRDRVAAVEARARDLRPVRTLALEWPEPAFVGGHWVPEMIRLAGGIDVLGKEGAPSRRATWSEIGESAPEVVVYMPCGYGLPDAEKQARDLRGRGMFEEARLYATDASSYFSRPGPRIVDGLEILAWCLHPDAFPAPQPGRAARIFDGVHE